MSNFSILYQAYGSIDIINECRFSLLRLITVYDRNRLTPPPIIIYTDQPAAFSIFSNRLNIITRLIDALQVDEWKGPHNFVHLVKINIIKDCLLDYPGKIIYTDTDTFCEKPLTDIASRMSASQVYMHQFEGILKTTPAFKKWKHFFETNAIPQMQAYSPINIEMWNAGVIGLQTEHLALLDEVHELTNELYGRFAKHIAEQLAFCYVFQKHGISIFNAEPFIFHYWNLKEFRQLLRELFAGDLPLNVLIEKSERIVPQKILAEKLRYKSLGAFSKLRLSLSGKAWNIKKYAV